ncbi:hypothetical protein ASJ80_09075 [Methanobacterium bryantii]|uniref:Uncharacterized protein n=1 Tax=Methanobacterium bryantii TaxID=2161 RepID=A0A2A2H7Z7_METBR|nr:hypothetical protein ASJ80_09075 [Methanobacterium bryantii]
MKLASQTPKIYIKIFECSENLKEIFFNLKKFYEFFGTVKRGAFEHVKNLRFFTVANFQFANIGNQRFPKVRKYCVFSKNQ